MHLNGALQHYSLSFKPCFPPFRTATSLLNQNSLVLTHLSSCLHRVTPRHWSSWLKRKVSSCSWLWTRMSKCSPPFMLRLRSSAFWTTNGWHMRCPGGCTWGCSCVQTHNSLGLSVLLRAWRHIDALSPVACFSFLRKQRLERQKVPRHVDENRRLPPSASLIVSFDLSAQHRGEAGFVWTQRTLRALCIKIMSTRCQSRDWRGRGSCIWKEITLEVKVEFDKDVALDLFRGLFVIFVFVHLNVASVGDAPPPSQSCSLLRSLDWWSNMFSIHLLCHTWATGNKHSCLCDRMNEKEQRERESGRVCVPESAMSLTCFPQLIYVNSTCRLWDKAFNTSDRNFMAYLLRKYFDGKSHSVFLSNNIPALHWWGFCKADLQIVKFSQEPILPLTGIFIQSQWRLFI